MNHLDTVLKLVTALRGLPEVARERRAVGYEVSGPTTVYVRASHCRVNVRRTAERRVQVECDLPQAFAWEWVTERDAAGIYVVLKRRPVVGALAAAVVTVTVPSDAYLVFNLTPGSVHLAEFEGRLAVAALEAEDGAG